MTSPDAAVAGVAPLPVLGEQPLSDLHERRTVIHHFGLARPLHIGDYLGPVRALRRLSADPDVDLLVTIEGEPEAAQNVAATLVACGLGAATFRRGRPTTAELDRVAVLPGGVPVADLCQPRIPMGTAAGESRGLILLLDTPLRVAAAVRRAHLDLNPLLGYDPQLRPGVSNLATILGGLTDRSPIAALYGLHGATELRTALLAALRNRLDPVRAAHADLAANPALMQRLLSPAEIPNHQNPDGDAADAASLAQRTSSAAY